MIRYHSSCVADQGQGHDQAVIATGQGLVHVANVTDRDRDQTLAIEVVVGVIVRAATDGHVSSGALDQSTSWMYLGGIDRSLPSDRHAGDHVMMTGS